MDLNMEGGHKPQNVGSLHKLAKAKKMNSLLEFLERNAALPTSSFQPSEIQFRLLTARTVR